MAPQKKYRRRIFLIDKNLQFYYIISVVVALIVVVVYMLIVFNLTIKTSLTSTIEMLSTKIENIIENPMISNEDKIGSISDKLINMKSNPEVYVADIISNINFTLFTTTLIIIGLIGFFSIYISHKIAGPVFKLRKFLNENVKNGILYERIFLRKHDQLKNLIQDFNEVLDIYEEKIKKIDILVNNIYYKYPEDEDIKKLVNELKFFKRRGHGGD